MATGDIYNSYDSGSSVAVLGSSAKPSLSKSDEFVFVNENDHQQVDSMESAEENFNTENFQGKEALSNTEQILLSRLRALAEENEGLRSVLLENNTAIENCFKELNHWQDEQKDNHEKLLDKYKQARNIITTLKQKNQMLKTELNETKTHIVDQNEERSVPTTVCDQSCDKNSELRKRMQQLEEENKLLCKEKLLVEKNVGMIQSQMMAIMSQGSEAENQVTDTESLLKAVDSLMCSLSLETAPEKNCTLPASGTPQPDINMNYEMLKTDFDQMKIDFDQMKSEKEQITEAIEKCQKEMENEKLEFEKVIFALKKQLQESSGAREKDNAGFRAEIEKKDEQISNCKRVNASLVEITNKNDEEIENLKAREKELANSIGEVTAELKCAQDKVQDLNQMKVENEKLRQTLETKDREFQLIINEKTEELNCALDKVQSFEVQREMKETEMLTSESLENEIPLQGDRLMSEYEMLKTKHEHLKIHLEKVEARNTTYLNELEEFKKKKGEFQRQSNTQQQLHEERMALQSEKEELEIHIQQISLENENLKGQFSTMYRDVVDKQNLISEMEARMAAFQEKSRKDAQGIANLRANLESQSVKCKRFVDERDSIRKEYTELLEQNEKLMKDNHEMLGRIQEASENKRSLEAEMKRFQEQRDEDAAKILTAEELVNNLKEEQAKMKTQINVQNTTTVPLLQQQANQYQTDFNAEREACVQLQEDNHTLREQLNILQQRSQRMEEQLDRFGNSRMEEMMRRHGSSLPNESRLPHSTSSPNLPQTQRQPTDDEFYHRLYQGYVNTVPQGDQNIAHSLPPDEPEIPEPCPVCNRQFVEMEELQNHVGECLAAHDEPPLRCPKCQEIFPDLDTLQIHVVACLDQDE